MIVTVTANTGLDFIYFIPACETGKTLRASRVVQSMSGKPADCSWILAEMGITSLALGFAAGHDRRDRQADDAPRAASRPISSTSRANRAAIWSSRPRTAQPHTAITSSSLIVSATSMSPRCAKSTSPRSTAANWSCSAGRCPKGMKPEFYTDLIALARERDIPVIFDAVEPNLSAGLASRPTYVKPNRDELSQFIGKPIETIEDAYRSRARVCCERYGTYPGDFAGRARAGWRCCRIALIASRRSTCRSSTRRARAMRCWRGWRRRLCAVSRLRMGLRLGFAAATAVVTTPGTAECSLPDIERYAAQIEVLPYERV